MTFETQVNCRLVVPPPAGSATKPIRQGFKMQQADWELGLRRNTDVLYLIVVMKASGIGGNLQVVMLL